VHFTGLGIQREKAFVIAPKARNGSSQAPKDCVEERGFALTIRSNNEDCVGVETKLFGSAEGAKTGDF
jgi:hypothetical protein